MRFAALLVVVIAFGNIGCIVGRPVFVPVAPAPQGRWTVSEKATVVAKPPYNDPTYEASVSVDYRF